MVAVTVCIVLQHVTGMGPCTSGLDIDVPQQCLTANGIDYFGALFVITNKRFGVLPPNKTYDTFKAFLCSTEKQDLVVPCEHKLIQKWNQSRCSRQDTDFMASKGNQLIGTLKNVCSKPCETAGNKTLVQCFTAAEVDLSYVMNTTILSDKFQLIGNDSNGTSRFCNSHQRLFSCLRPLHTDCPETIERLYTVGIDLQGLELATKVQCQDIDAYLGAAKCFASPALAIQQCGQETDLWFEQVQKERHGVSPSRFMECLCQIKMSKVDCLLWYYEGICGAPAAELLSSFECTSMPKPCRTNPEALPVYTSMCQSVSTPLPAAKPRPINRVTRDGNQDDDDLVDSVGVVAVSYSLVFIYVAMASVIVAM